MWCGLFLVLWLAAPGLLGAFSPPVVLPLDDVPEISLDATGLDIAIGTISQDVTFQNPRGALYNRQILRIELTSEVPHQVRWLDQWQARHGMPLPTKTTGNNLVDLFLFEYISTLRIWSFIGTTQWDVVALPPPAR